MAGTYSEEASVVLLMRLLLDANVLLDCLVADALQVACAVSVHADYIITRNVKDFMACSVPAITPEKFLSGLAI